MSKATKYLIMNPSGSVIGVGFTPDGHVPAHGIPCTASQASNWQWCTVADGAILEGTPIVSPREQATTALTKGLTVTSISDPKLDNIYPIDATTVSEIQSEIISIMHNSTFSDGASEILWHDIDNHTHDFSISQFKSLGMCILSYVSKLNRIIKLDTGDLPPSAYKI